VTTWDPSAVPDQQGRRVIVTGASGGLGLVVARELARRGARVVMAARDVAKAERHRSEVLAEHPAATAEVRPLDLLDLDSIREFAASVTAEPVDALVNVAGIAGGPLRRNAQGWESHFATNHLGHFALTMLLLDALDRGWEPRVVTVSSTTYRFGKLDLDRDDHLTGGRRYSPMRAYARSKLACMLFGLELDRKLRAAGSEVRSVLAHPGTVGAEMQVDRAPTLLGCLMAPHTTTTASAPEQAALPVVYAATVSDIEGGTFVGTRSEGHGPMRVERLPVRAPADDIRLAERLWTHSEELTGARPALFCGTRH
jgi:NAD(P)-dependent dehydrogenase (short-subunit alcohol dehydrogenase family)